MNWSVPKSFLNSRPLRGGRLSLTFLFFQRRLVDSNNCKPESATTSFIFCPFSLRRFHTDFDSMRLQQEQNKMSHQRLYTNHNLTSSPIVYNPVRMCSKTWIAVVMKASSTFSPFFADASMNSKPCCFAYCSPSWKLPLRGKCVIQGK